MFYVLSALVSGFVIGLLALVSSRHCAAGGRHDDPAGKGGSLLARRAGGRATGHGPIASIAGTMALVFIGRHLG